MAFLGNSNYQKYLNYRTPSKKSVKNRARIERDAIGNLIVPSANEDARLPLQSSGLIPDDPDADLVRAGFRVMLNILSIDRRPVKDDRQLGYIVFDGPSNWIFATNGSAMVAMYVPLYGTRQLATVRALRISSASPSSAFVKKKAAASELPFYYSKDIIEVLDRKPEPHIREFGLLLSAARFGDIKYKYAIGLTHYGLSDLEQESQKEAMSLLPKFRRFAQLTFPNGSYVGEDGVIRFRGAPDDLVLQRLDPLLQRRLLEKAKKLPLEVDVELWGGLVQAGVLDGGGAVAYPVAVHSEELASCLEFPYLREIGVWQGNWEKIIGDGYDSARGLLLAGDYFRCWIKAPLDAVAKKGDETIKKKAAKKKTR
jgi:hypothetical protein